MNIRTRIELKIYALFFCSLWIERGKIKMNGLTSVMHHQDDTFFPPNFAPRLANPFDIHCRIFRTRQYAPLTYSHMCVHHQTIWILLTLHDDVVQFFLCSFIWMVLIISRPPSIYSTHRSHILLWKFSEKYVYGGREMWSVGIHSWFHFYTAQVYLRCQKVNTSAENSPRKGKTLYRCTDS